MPDDKKRQRDLVLEAAKCFANHCSPFETPWLSEHGVTLNECFWLSDYIGELLKASVTAPGIVQGALVMSMAGMDSAMVEEYLLSAVTDLARKRVRNA